MANLRMNLKLKQATKQAYLRQTMYLKKQLKTVSLKKKKTAWLLKHDVFKTFEINHVQSFFKDEIALDN